MARRIARAAARTVAMVAFPGAQALDVVGPLEVFALANDWLADQRQRAPFYRLETLAERAGPLRTSGPSRLVADRALGRPRRDIDTLLVAGGDGVMAAVQRPSLVRWVAATAAHCRRVGSVCSGAFLLAQAGLLDGRRVATHWSRCEELQRRYPSLSVDRDALYVRDGRCVTSAGITAGIDLALALVEEDLDRVVALGVARQLVVFLYRSGSQSQFSHQLSAQLAEREPLRDVQAYIADRPGADLDVPALARRAALSPRQFARVFKAELGVTPARYVESVRLEAARAMLERTSRPVEQVAARCGFGTPESLRRRFVARLGVSPSVYRGRFARSDNPLRPGRAQPQ
jgi:transcriptional regulator GlxA family with amidase domain